MGPGMVESAQKGLIQHLVDKAGLSRAGDAGDHGQGSQGDVHVHIFEVVFRRPQNPEEFPISRAAALGQGNLFNTGQILSRDGAGAADDILQGARRHDLAAVAARPGAHVHNEVRGAHGVLVVFHHDEGVAQIPQMLQR